MIGVTVELRVFQLLFLHMLQYLIGVWLSGDQRTNTIKNTCLKEIGLDLQF